MKRVLVASLDWGLGHATRCIPVIRELQRQGCDVAIAGSGDSLALLRREFPDIHSFVLPAYDPRYSLNGSMTLTMVRQLPHFSRVIAQEHEALQKIIREQSIEFVISDNRYGCWTKTIPSVFITHQSNVMMPKGLGFFRSGFRGIHEHFIERFGFLWIPDMPANESLAGELATVQKEQLRKRVRYIGWLSRFNRKPQSEGIRYEVMAILSGPEPQRTQLENILLPQLQASGFRYLLVRGLLSSSEAISDASVANFLTTPELQKAMNSSAIVIARSGYSTIMDVKSMGGKAIFIPTPGQTEQEYLAEVLKAKGIAFAMPQDKFLLSTALAESKRYSGFQPSTENDLLARAVQELVLVDSR